MPSWPATTGSVSALLDALARGDVSTVELTAPLSADTPVLDLPPDMAPRHWVTGANLEDVASVGRAGSRDRQDPRSR